MPCPHTPSTALELQVHGVKQRVSSRWISIMALATLGLLPRSVLALDGCEVMLCLAAPDWRSIPRCSVVINQLMRDLAKGKPFPTCDSTSAGNTASHSWAGAPANCPPQYITDTEGPNGPQPRCEYSGVISVSVEGQLFTQTWWRWDGDSVTDFRPDAKQRLGSWNTRFDDELAAWLAAQPPAQPVDPYGNPQQ